MIIQNQLRNEAIMIVKVLPGNYFAANCFIVASETTGRGMIIDPCAKVNDITDALEELKISVSVIALTHVHVDHFCAVEAVKNATKAQLAVFDDRDIKAAAAAAIAAEASKANEVTKRFVIIPFELPIPPDRWLHEGDVIDIDDLHFSVLYTPGHTPDSVSFFGHGAVFSGDTLFRRKIGALIPGLYSGYDLEQLKTSIREKLLSLPDDTIVYPGHGAATTIGEERTFNVML